MEYSTSRLNKPKKPTIIYDSAKVIPYFVEGQNLYLLWGISQKWKEYTPIGGTCKKTENYTKSEDKKKCLAREVYEETKELLTLSHLGEFNKINTVLSKLKWGKIYNHYYFVKWLDQEDERNKILDNFYSSQRDSELRQKLQEKNLNVSDYFELSGLEAIPVRSHRMYDLLYNTITDLHLRKDEYLHMDRVFYTLMYRRLIVLLENYPLKPENEQVSTDNNRFDHHILVALLEILETHHQYEYGYLDDLIDDLYDYIMDR